MWKNRIKIINNNDKIDNVNYSLTFKYINTEYEKDINELNEGLFIIGIQSLEKQKYTKTWF